MLATNMNRSTFDPAVFLAQAGDGFIQEWGDLEPGFAAGFVQGGLHVGLLFAGLTAGFAAEKIDGGQPRGLEQPTGKRLGPHARGFLGKDDKDDLRYLLGMLRIAALPQRDGIDEIDVPGDERGKGFVRSAFHVAPQQRGVIR